MTILYALYTFKFQRSHLKHSQLCTQRTALLFWSPRALSHWFYPPALTFSGEESWSSPAFWSAPGSQHPQVDRVASSRSEPFQTPAVFGPGACDQQLIHQPDSLPKPKKYSLILMKHSVREALNTERAICMDSLAPVHWALEDLTSSEPQVDTCTCSSPQSGPLAAASPLVRLSLLTLRCPPGSQPQQTHRATSLEPVTKGSSLLPSQPRAWLTLERSTRKCFISIFLAASPVFEVSFTADSLSSPSSVS